jgi:proteic killer suppression protein
MLGVNPVRLTLRRQPPRRSFLHALRSAARRVSRIVGCNLLGYTWSVAIKSFRHKGLERFFATGSKQGIQAKQADRLRLVLGLLHAATSPRDLGLPGLDLHELQGTRRGTWAVKVSGNWRVTFGFAGKDAQLVDYEDYH